MKEVIDHLNAPVIMLNKADLGPNYFNHICSTFFKLPPRKLNALKNLDELIEGDASDLKKLMMKALEEDTPLVSEEIRFETKAIGEPKTVIFKIIPTADQVALSILDLTIENELHSKYKRQVLELKQGHEQIVLADKLTALGELTANVGHEISTPLLVANDRLDQLQVYMEKKDLSSSKQKLTELRGEFSRIQTIIKGMQNFAGARDSDQKVADLFQVLSNAIDFVSGLKSATAVEIKRPEPTKASVFINQVKLEQVLINLIKNSIDAINESKTEHGEVSFEVVSEISSQSQVLRIIDNGPGISKENQTHIFDMFYTTKEIGEGTGLGLPISKKIIESTQGSLELKSSKPGKTIFEIKLPMLEFGSFTYTNRYLRGESELEDDIVLIVSDSIEELNQVLEKFSHQHKVFILSLNSSELQELGGFFMLDQAIKLVQCDLSFSDCDVHDLSEKTPKEKTEYLGKLWQN